MFMKVNFKILKNKTLVLFMNKNIKYLKFDSIQIITTFIQIFNIKL